MAPQLTKDEIDLIYCLSFKQEDFEQMQEAILNLAKKYGVCTTDIDTAVFYQQRAY